MPSQEGSVGLAFGRTVGKSLDKSMGGPRPGDSPELQGPCFCPTSWSLAGSPSLQQGYGVCRVSGGAVMAKVGVTQNGLWWPGRQPNPCLADEGWLPFSILMGAR